MSASIQSVGSIKKFIFTPPDVNTYRNSEDDPEICGIDEREIIVQEDDDNGVEENDSEVTTYEQGDTEVIAKENKKDQLSLLDFKASVATCLFKQNKDGQKKRGRPSSSSIENQIHLKKKGPIAPLSEKEIRKNEMSHWPQFTEKRRRFKKPGCCVARKKIADKGSAGAVFHAFILSSKESKSLQVPRASGVGKTSVHHILKQVKWRPYILTLRAKMAQIGVSNFDKTSVGRWVGRPGSVEQPPRSPDLTPLDIYLRGTLNNTMYATKLRSLATVSNLQKKKGAETPSLLAKPPQVEPQSNDVCRLLQGREITVKALEKCVLRHVQRAAVGPALIDLLVS
ncbi:hypothetical protein PR048_002549 [Dryococelus australis]|uniref:Uncharacterized protein n=1 Tax=Dryococelus australis TaxID=614101 RepID=A0ABQ9IMW8_9NEOP|nr:hypothetical protein PR048_002549 [Dryococelus australis]